jgi:hypothetical protein
MQFQSMIPANELTDGKSPTRRISDSRQCEREAGWIKQLAQYRRTSA